MLSRSGHRPLQSHSRWSCPTVGSPACSFQLCLQGTGDLRFIAALARPLRSADQRGRTGLNTGLFCLHTQGSGAVRMLCLPQFLWAATHVTDLSTSLPPPRATGRGGCECQERSLGCNRHGGSSWTPWASWIPRQTGTPWAPWPSRRSWHRGSRGPDRQHRAQG